MKLSRPRLLCLPLLFLGGALAGCPLSPPTVGGYPIVCTGQGQCRPGERCDLAYGICVGLSDGGIIGEDGGPRDGGPCKTATCFGSIVLTPAGTDVGGALYAGAGQPLVVLAELDFLGNVTSAPAPETLDLSVSAPGGDAGGLTMAWVDGGPNGYFYSATWPTVGVADLPFTFVASLTGDAGTLSSDPVVVTVDNTAPTLSISLLNLVDGGPPLPRDFQSAAVLTGDDHGGSGIPIGSYQLSGTGVPSSSTATWPVTATTAAVKGRDLKLDTGAAGLAGTFTLTGHVSDQVGNQGTATLSVPVTRLKWKLQLATGKAIDSSPVLGSHGRIYVGGNDQQLHAVNPDGTLLWAYLAGDRITATPAVHVLDAASGAEIIYAPSQDTNVHAVIGFDGGLVTGWTMLNTQTVATAPNIPASLINSAAISPTENSIVVGDNGGHVFSMGMDTGIATGSYPQSAVTPTLQSCSAVSIAGTTSLLAVVVGQDKNMYRFTNVGVSAQPSAVPLANSDSVNTGQLGGLGISATEAWVGGASGVHHFTNLLSGPVDAEVLPSSGYFIGLAIGSSGSPYASRLDGTLIGVAAGGIATTLAPNLAAPPTIGADGNIYVGTTDGKIASVRADGSIAWEGGLTGAAINSAPMIDPCNETLYVGSGDGFLFAVITDAAGLDPGPWPHFRHDYQGTGNASLVGAVDCANHL